MKLRKAIIVMGVILVFLVNAGSVMAERVTGTYTLTPFIGGYLFDSDLDLENKSMGMWGAGLGYTLDKTWDVEGVIRYIDTESEVDQGDVAVYQYGIDGLYHFMPSRQFVPYLAAGIGGITINPDGRESDTDSLVNYGAGVKYFLADNVALRGDIRHIISLGSPYHNLSYLLGVTFFFGGEKKMPMAPPADIDGDGVPDHLDRCPNTPQGVSVDSTGCPLDTDGDGVYDYLDQCPDTPKGVKVDARGCPLDSDGDGVYDYQDQCPDTPRGVTVDSKGCPIDSDGDGVPDHLDRCPDTPRGASVNVKGCWVLTGILFDTAKWDIKPQAYEGLDQVVDILKKNPTLKLEIQGHTDNKGSARYNKRLSENRAKAVMGYLVEKGIGEYRLSAVGLWFSRPVASNDTPEGRAQNRRVELKPIY
jgi:OOP family OmpA-OmpF porin